MEIELRAFINPQFGEQYPARMEFEWATDLVSYGQKSQRNQLWAQPTRHWYINYEALTKAGRDKFLEIFNRAHGRARTFLLADKDDFACTAAECSITATAGDTTTQLIKSYFPVETETWDEDKKKIVPSGIYAPSVWLDAAAKTEGTHFTLDDTTGIIDWTGGSAPNGAMGGGEVITADYHFYFQVRFDFDRHADIRNIPDHWQATGIHLVEDE